MDWERLIEGIVSGAARRDEGRALSAAKARFALRTGPFEPKDPWYEPRTRAFMTAYAVGSLGLDPLRAVCAELGEGSEEDARALASLAHAQRGLYQGLARLEGATLVEEGIRGARFRVTERSPATRLREGDLFDGWLLWHEGEVCLLPGPIFHPPAAHEPIRELLREAQDRDADELLDGMLRMHMRLQRFVSIRAPHVYRLEALDDREILSATWARKPRSPN